MTTTSRGGMTGDQFRALDTLNTRLRDVTDAVREMGDAPLTLPSHLKAIMAELAEINTQLRRDGPAFEDSAGAIVYRSGRRWMPRATRDDTTGRTNIEWFEADPLPGAQKGGHN